MAFRKRRLLLIARLLRNAIVVRDIRLRQERSRVALYVSRKIRYRR